jgi:hypothetical protein
MPLSKSGRLTRNVWLNFQFAWRFNPAAEQVTITALSPAVYALLNCRALFNAIEIVYTE